MNVDQAVLRDIVNSEVERQVADHLNESIATAVEGTFMNATQLAADSVEFQKKSAPY